jgi:hypothetical protein
MVNWCSMFWNKILIFWNILWLLFLYSWPGNIQLVRINFVFRELISSHHLERRR